MAETNLSIEALERDLKNGLLELEKATANRLRAHELETQWVIETSSLKNLIEVRRKRIGATEKQSTLESPNVPPEDLIFALSQPTNAPPPDAMTHVNWIYLKIKESGNRGMSPPEILKAAASAGINMHKNYPYVVLKGLMEKEKVTKREGRYYAA